jgi:hypothetical protein
MRAQLSLYCSAGSNTFYYAPEIPCLLRKASYVANAAQGATKTCVLSKNGGNTIISGDINATAGVATEGALTATLTDKKQVISKANPLKIVIDFTGGAIATVVMDLDLDEFQVNTE